MGLPIVREAVLIGEEERESVEVMCQGTAPQRMSALPILREGFGPADVSDAQEGRVFRGLRPARFGREEVLSRFFWAAEAVVC